MLHNGTISSRVKALLLMLLMASFWGCQSLPKATPADQQEQEEESQESQPEQKIPAKPPVVANKPPAAPPTPEQEPPARIKQVLAPPQIPTYQWRDYARINAVMITDKQWQAIQRYHKEFMLYASQVQAMILASDPDVRLPRVPTLILPTTQNVPSQDVPATERNQRHLSLSMRDSQAVDTFIRESKSYIATTQELL